MSWGGGSTLHRSLAPCCLLSWWLEDFFFWAGLWNILFSDICAAAEDIQTKMISSRLVLLLGKRGTMFVTWTNYNLLPSAHVYSHLFLSMRYPTYRSSAQSSLGPFYRFLYVCLHVWLGQTQWGKKWSHIFPYIKWGGGYMLLCHGPKFCKLYCPRWLLLFFVYAFRNLTNSMTYYITGALFFFTYIHTISVYCCVSHKWAWRQGNKWSVLDDHWTTYLILEKPRFRIIILKLLLLKCVFC